MRVNTSMPKKRMKCARIHTLAHLVQEDGSEARVLLQKIDNSHCLALSDGLRIAPSLRRDFHERNNTAKSLKIRLYRSAKMIE